MTRLHSVPISQREANAFIRKWHRHHLPPLIDIFRVAVAVGDEVVGVATVNHPVARALTDGWTVEVSRCCVRTDMPEAKHAASKLYAMAWRIAREMGYKRMLTYTLADETGTSLVAAGWRVAYQTNGATWEMPNRPRVDKWPTGPKTLWEVAG